MEASYHPAGAPVSFRAISETDLELHIADSTRYEATHRTSKENTERICIVRRADESDSIIENESRKAGEDNY